MGAKTVFLLQHFHKKRAMGPVPSLLGWVYRVGFTGWVGATAGVCGRRDSCIYIFTGVRPKKNGGGSCRRGGAHPMPWLRRGGRRGCAHPIPRLRRSAPKRHRRERTATEVAPPHSPYAAPRLTLHVSDVLEEGRLSSALHILYKI